MQNVRDTKRWRKANKRVWWFHLPRDFPCKDSLLGVRGNADEVAHVFHFLYCGSDEHGFVDHAEQIIFVQQYQKPNFRYSGWFISMATQMSFAGIFFCGF